MNDPHPLEYLLLDPTGNITILVKPPVPPAAQPALASALLRAEPTAEQVGFLSPGDGACEIALRMAGGEFCGNAAMSAAALYCAESGIATACVRVAVSGAEGCVPVEVCALPNEEWLCAVAMPPAREIAALTLPGEDGEITLPSVDMGGIRHLILREPMPRPAAEQAARRWCFLLGASALGLMQLDCASGCLEPLVYVPGVDSLYWERSCASGTAAVGCYLAHAAGAPVRHRFVEPGGVLEVSASPDGASVLRGTVRIVRRGRWENA